MKRAIVSLFILVLSFPSFGAVIAKAGLAGGAFRIAGEIDRQLNDKISLIGEVGYGIGNQYSLLTAGTSGIFNIKENFYAGVGVNYSSYSNTVRLGLPAIDITEKSGVGAGVFAGLKRDKMYGQIGYDTRLGAVAEAGYIVRM
jgi:hypothetical protein